MLIAHLGRPFRFGLIAAAAFTLAGTASPAFAQKGPPTPIDVKVTNPVLPVRDVERKPLAPWRTMEVAELPDASGGTSYCCFGEPVPPGKTLVMEYVTAKCAGGLGQSFRLEIAGGIDGVDPESSSYIFPILVHQSSSGITAMHASEQMRLYFPAGSRFGATINRSSSQGAAQCRIQLSGQLVDAPAAN